jgi:MFS family permease
MVDERERYGGSRWPVALLLLLIIVIGYLARLNISVALPFISEDYSWSQNQQGMLGGLLLGSFLISYGLSSIFLSPLVDLLGSKNSLIGAIFLWSISTLIGALLGQIYSIFVISRIFLGTGQGILFPVASKITQGSFPLKERSRANAPTKGRYSG